MGACHISAAALDAWVATGWLAPKPGSEPEAQVSETACAWLIHDLHQMGINDVGVSVILDLIDLGHGLRRALRAFLAAQ
jgi:hypothetical protein